MTATSSNDSNIVVNLEVSTDKINLNDSEMLRLMQDAQEEREAAIAKKEEQNKAYDS